MFLSLFKTNLWCSRSYSLLASKSHCLFSIAFSLVESCLSWFNFYCLWSFCQSKILIVSWPANFFSSNSLLSLSIFFCSSSFHNWAYTYSSIMFCSIWRLLSINCFSLSIWHPWFWNLVSSNLKSSFADLNLFSSLLWTSSLLSSSLCFLSSSSLTAIFYLTCSGVSRFSMNSFSNIMSSYSRMAASFALLSLRSLSCLFFMLSRRFLTKFFLIMFSVLLSQFALWSKFLSPLIPSFKFLKCYKISNRLITILPRNTVHICVVGSL